MYPVCPYCRTPITSSSYYKFPDGLTLLHLAAKRDNVEILNFLLASGFNINATDEDDMETSSLMVAAENGSLNTLSRLIMASAC